MAEELTPLSSGDTNTAASGMGAFSRTYTSNYPSGSDVGSFYENGSLGEMPAVLVVSCSNGGADAVGYDDDEQLEDDDVMIDIQKRRSVKHHRGAGCSSSSDSCIDVADEAWGSKGGVSAVARRTHVEYEYLCRWKYSEAGWLPRLEIEDLGYGGLCDKYDEAHMPQNQGKPAVPLRTVHPSAKLDVAPGQLVERLGTMPVLLAKVREALVKHRVLRYAAVGSTRLERSFYQMWQSKDAAATPEFCYVALDTCELYNMSANGVQSNPKYLQDSLISPHDKYLWCCLLPESPLVRAADGAHPVVLLLCAALTSKSFLDHSWREFRRENGWFPMPMDAAKLIPLVVFDTRHCSSLDGMDVLLAKEPQQVERFERFVEGLNK